MRDRFGLSISDHEYRQRLEIEDALGREQVLGANADSVSTYIRGLQRDVDELRVTVGILVQMLAEANQVDATVVRYRVEAALDELHAAQPADNTARTEMPATTTCVRCRHEVPTASTVMTAGGACCDPACSR